MKTKQLVEENRVLQAKLNKENENYYGNFLIYIRCMSAVRDEQKTEEILLEILEDILQGQEKGISAEEYLGKNPKQVADSILKELPINKMDAFKLILVAMCSFLFASIIPTLASYNNYIDLGKLVISGIYSSCFALSVLFFMGYTLYRYKSKWMRMLLIGYLFIGIMIGLLMLYLIKTPLLIPLSNTWGILLIVFFLLVLVYCFVKTDEKKIWVPFIPIVLVCAVIGIITRLSFFKRYLEGSNARTSIAILMILALFLTYSLMWSINRKKSESTTKMYNKN